MKFLTWFCCSSVHIHPFHRTQSSALKLSVHFEIQSVSGGIQAELLNIGTRSCQRRRSMAFDYTVATDKSIEQSITDLTAALKEQGFGVLGIWIFRRCLNRKAWSWDENIGCLKYATQRPLRKRLIRTQRQDCYCRVPSPST